MKNDRINDEGRGLTLGPYGEIPRRLREYYDSIQEEALPDRFLDLLEQLDRAEKAELKSKDDTDTGEVIDGPIG